jgi:DNA-binding transcriptional regulator GbsR (MarR family)
MDSNKVMVGCRVSEGRKDRWDEFIADSTEYNTTAQLIRTGVERVISESESDEEKQLEMIQDDLQGVLREIKQTRLDIDKLEESIDDAEDVSDELMYELQRFFSESDER